MTELTELEELRAFKELVESSFSIDLNMNDTFGWACAEGERMPVEDIKHVLPLFQQYKWAALSAYAAVKRGCDVMDHPKVRTQAYWDAKAKLQVLKANIPYFMEE